MKTFRDIFQKTALIVGLLVLFHSSLSAHSAPDFLVSVTGSGDYRTVLISPPKGHHFNTKAPHTFEYDLNKKIIVKVPKKVNPTHISYEAPAHAHFRASAFLCDDAKTFCEKHSIQGFIEQLPTGISDFKESSLVSGKDEKLAKANYGAKAAERHGFIYNNSTKALAQAAKEHKPLLIEFFGIWCPPCNMLDSEVFSTKEYRSLSKKFVTLKLDADDSASWPLKARYKVGGYPTIVFADENGEEITRVVGSRTQVVFLRFMENAYSLRKTSFKTLVAQASTGNAESAYRAALIYLERNEAQEAVALLEKIDTTLPERKEKLWLSRIGVAKKVDMTDHKGSLLEVLEKAYKELAPSPARLSIAKDLAEAHGSLGHKEIEKRYLENVVNIATDVLASGALPDDSDYSVGDLGQEIGEAQASLKQDDEARTAYINAGSAYKRAILALE